MSGTALRTRPLSVSPDALEEHSQLLLEKGEKFEVSEDRQPCNAGTCYIWPRTRVGCSFARALASSGAFCGIVGSSEGAMSNVCEPDCSLHRDDGSMSNLERTMHSI